MQESLLILAVLKNFIGIVKYWKRLTIRVVESPFPKNFKNRLKKCGLGVRCIGMAGGYSLGVRGPSGDKGLWVRSLGHQQGLGVVGGTL